MANNFLGSFINEIDNSEQELYGIKILQNGTMIDEYYWVKDEPRNVHSISKTVLSFAVGLMVQENRVFLEDSLADFFQDYINERNKKYLSHVFLRHLLMLSVGQNTPYLMMDERENLKEANWVSYSLNKPFSFKPGERFIYSNVGPYLAGVAIQNRIDIDLIAYLKKRLLDPLKIDIEKWEKDPMGHYFGAGGIYLTLTDLTKLAQLLLQDGQWHAKQVLSSDWINLSRYPFIKTNSEDIYTDYYGYGLWIDTVRNTYRMDGAFGQMALMVPDKNTVIAITAKNGDNIQNLEKIYRLIYPKL